MIATRPLVQHIVRSLVWATLLVLALPYPPLAAVVAAFVFFSTFAFFHDCAHGALGLPTTANDLVLALTSGPLFMSAHGQRQLHLRHHAHPLADDDMEGEGALTNIVWAALTAPLASVRMRIASFTVVPRRIQPWVIGENVFNAAVAAAAVASGHAGVQAAVATWILLQITMNAWASHVPHRAPKWALNLAAKLAFTGSPVVLSLVYHLEHHAHPRVPCSELRPDLDVKQSPLLEHAPARPQTSTWAQLQLDTRPRPAMRRMVRGQA